MRQLAKWLVCLIVILHGTAFADNQTSTVSDVQSQNSLPFRVIIEQMNFQLPVGFHSGVIGTFRGLWILIAGRTNGLHGFDPAGNFPPDKQNTTIYVVNPATGSVIGRALSDASSGLTQQQIDTLSVTSPQAYQDGTTLYMTGGYGFNAGDASYSTKPVLTAFNLPGVVNWVMGKANTTLASNIQQLYNPIFQITGGRMYKVGDVTQLVFGQNFIGPYTTSGNGEYSKQIRRFQIVTSKQLSVNILPSLPQIPDPSYRRRDFNLLPTLLNKNNLLKEGLVAYSGVFTLTGGVWTVPVVIDENGNSTMADPNLSTTFAQAMNQYVCPTASLYSGHTLNMYHIFFGGLSYGFFSSGTFQTDTEIPFINQVTTIKMDANGSFTQYLMNSEYPVIISTGSNPGNQLLFGAGGVFIPSSRISHYNNRVINLDSIREPTILGYIIGGIQSTLPNTNTQADSSASPYIFKVTLVPL
jgi:hypothetical protein